MSVSKDPIQSVLLRQRAKQGRALYREHICDLGDLHTDISTIIGCGFTGFVRSDRLEGKSYARKHDRV